MIKIRLARHGSKKRPFYQIVLSDVRSSRNGKFIEKLGFFNPITSKKEEQTSYNLERIKYWLKIGAKMSKKVKTILKKK
ncbi:30S ribosomal protein S16 [Buchnera aphidicola]|uniref:Small ribosomal subunit protein bS16 n=1 Tax=Buchnera aphidicola subsp. Tuberolachnus salignus TaxID=98804 RepID=A0A170PC51_BUCTT|nr:30S ribosomal protein S16 [Buchnera aphidicola]CUR53239.1 30S ribosomal protein S16 [Buchnera aphidicola (Tuberolachnus salignus)]